MSERSHIRTTCPRDCYDSCGIVVELEAGRVRRVLGDREHPVSRGSLCAKCAIAYNGVWLDPQARLTRPLRRTGPKGEGRFEPVSWDEALNGIAGRLNAIRAEEPARILTGHYTGTCSVLANMFPMRFFNAIGATEIEPDTICNNAGHVALNYVLGSSAKGFDPRTARDTRCLVVWGCNPSASAPHAHDHWLREQPGRLVVIDPIRTPTAEIADIHLAPLPGTDAILAFGMANVMLHEGLVDEAFIAAHTVGFEALQPLIAATPVARAASVTGVPQSRIEEVARLYAEGPSLLWLGQALQRQASGGNVFRACAMLPALTGNIGRPGAGLYYLNGKGPTRGMDLSVVSRPDLRPAGARSISHMDLVEALDDPARSAALILWNINVVASNPRQRDLRRALMREDLLTVAVDLFPTDSAAYADYVLPAASFLEFDDLVGSYMHLSFGAQAQAAPPMGESLPNQEIFRRLAAAMGLDEPSLQEPDAPILAALMRQTGLGIDFETLKKRGTVEVGGEPVVLWQDLKFPTPSGRIELASQRASADGHPATALPLADEPPSDGRLRLLSPASPWHMNSSYDNDARIARRAGPAAVTLNPSDAAARGLKDGALARLFNETGEIRLRVAVSDMTPPGVAYSPKGRWPGRDTNGANINVLNPGERSDMGDSTAVHGVEVMVEAVAE